MKTVKIILGIITVISVVFFATGLFIIETQYSTEITINKDLDEVFKVLTNPEETKNWIPEIKEKSIAKQTTGVTGSVYNVVVVNQDQEIKMTEQVRAYVPNEKLTLYYEAENMLKTNDYLFSKEGDATRVLLNATCKSDSYIMSCLFPYFKGTFKAQDAQYLQNLKNYLERDSDL